MGDPRIEIIYNVGGTGSVAESATGEVQVVKVAASGGAVQQLGDPDEEKRKKLQEIKQQVEAKRQLLMNKFNSDI